MSRTTSTSFNRNLFAALVAFAASGMANQAMAQASDAEVAELRAQIEALSARLAQLETVTVEAAQDDSAVEVSMGRGGLDVTSADGEYDINIGGRLHLDYVHHENVDGLPVVPVSGSAIRRSRLEIDGTIAGNWKFAAEIDLAENRTKMKDVKMGYEGDNYTIYAGHQKQPYSLALEMSSNDMPWVERAVDNAMVSELTDRAIGVRFDTWGDHWFTAVGVFGEELGNEIQGDEGWATVGRFIWSPVISENAVVHLGLRGTQRRFGDPLELRIKDKTSEYSGFSIVDTGTLAMTEKAEMFGPEFALAYGPLLVVGEYTRGKADRIGMPDADFSGWHVGAALSLTGEKRASVYRIDSGEFKGLRPARSFNPAEGDWGGFELTARYSTIDLTDGLINGGEQDVLNAGINWIVNPSIRMMFDWMHILDTDESNLVRTLTPDMDIFTIRTQYNY